MRSPSLRTCAGEIKSVLLVLMVFGFALNARPAAAATILSLEPSLTTVSVGDAFTLDVAITDVTDLFDYQFDVNFNPLLLQASSVSGGGFLTSGGGTSVFGGAFVLTLDNTTGLITILDSLLGPVPPATGVTGSGLLASIKFSALAPGARAVTLTNLILEDSNGGSIDAQTVDARVVVNSTVPEPATLLLFGSGLTAGFWKSRRRRSSV